MKKIILFICVGLFIYGCNNNDSSDKFKEMSEIEKLTKKQFAEEVVAIHYDVYQKIGKLLDKHSEIDAGFENEIDALHYRSVIQMIEYGKVLALKNEKTKNDYIAESLYAMIYAMEKRIKETGEFEKIFDQRLPELEAYGDDNLKRKFNELFSIMDFLDLETIKENYHESTKEFELK